MFLKIPKKFDFLSGICLKMVEPKNSNFFFNFFGNLLHMYAEFV
jgi:hypothetical protein